MELQREYDVVVIGAGQAGLAAGYYLKKNNYSFVVLDKGTCVGDSWRNRYDSLVLFTPRWYSSLPGLNLKGDPNGYAGKDEIADYLEYYAEYFSIPVQMNTEIILLEQTSTGFRVMTNQGQYTAKHIIVATGPFQKPIIPKMAEYLSNDIFQVHSSSYINPSQLNEGEVLVIGAGNSGAQIAVELAKEREVILSVGHKMKFLPLEFFGKSIFEWFKKLGILSASIDSKLGRWISKQYDPIFGYELKKCIENGEVVLKPRTYKMTEDVALFEDKSSVQVKNIIWATGFTSDYNWIDINKAFDDKGKPIHQRGKSSIRGLFFLGLPWQYRRGSALIGGVAEDARYVVDAVKLP